MEIALFPFALVVVIWCWPLVWSYFVRDKIHLDMSVFQRYGEIGQPIPVQIAISNRAWLPCPMVEVIIRLPNGLSAHPDEFCAEIRRHTHLWMRQRVTLETHLYGVARGVQQIREASIHIHEGFGMREEYVVRPLDTFVSIYPKRLPSTPPSLINREWLGHLEVIRWLHPDETVLRGMRAYRPGDSTKHIAWRTSARTGALTVKQFASTTESSVVLLLNAQLFEPYWSGTIVETFDQLCSVAYDICTSLTKQGVPTFFGTNSIISRDPKRQWHGLQSPESVRTLCARAQPYANSPLNHLLDVVQQETPATVPMVIVTAFLTRKEVAYLAHMVKMNRTVQLVCPAGVCLPPVPPAVFVYRLKRVEQQEAVVDV